jgi:hypothetical protein
MLRRFFRLAVLLLALPAVGVPAIVCAANQPMHDCCPGKPKAPCGDDGSSGPAWNRLQPCCAQAASAYSACWVAESPKDLQKQPQQPDPSPLAVSFLARSASRFDSLQPIGIGPTASSFSGPAPLYLSTGRLRL